MTTDNEHFQEMYNLRRFGIVLDLRLIQEIIRLLEIPTDAFRSIHIAGTNGKGSIAASLSSILSLEGYRTGLYTSPHLVKFNERISISGVPIQDEEIEPLFQKVKSVSTRLERTPTFFEYTTAMAFYYFFINRVDWAVIETGMGGRLDATNVITPEISIITNVTLEHQTYLGDTLSAISAEKAGIIKPNTPVVTGVHQPEALHVLRETAAEKKADLYVMGKDFSAAQKSKMVLNYKGIWNTFQDIRINLEGSHQIANASLVLAAMELLNRKKETASVYSIREGLASTRWPGRLERVLTSPLVILDGAHNLDAAENLSRYFSENLREKDIVLVLGILDDKPHIEIIRCLVKHCSRLIVTQPKINRAIPVQRLFETVSEFTDRVTAISDVGEALDYAIDTAKPDDAICVAGSLYVVGEAKIAIEKRK